MPEKICKVEGCGESADYKDNGHLGYCCGHYKKLKRYGDPNISHKKKRGICSVSGCEREAYAHGLCNMHYQRERANGDPLVYKCDRESGLQQKYPDEYRIYMHMKERCYDKNSKAYKNYGARGIKIDEDWLGDDGFANFIRDMGPRPEGKYPSGAPKFSIDRINNDKNYGPGNCRWADKRTQALNTRRSVEIPNCYKRENGQYSVSIYANGKTYWRHAKNLQEAIKKRQELERTYL